MPSSRLLLRFVLACVLLSLGRPKTYSDDFVLTNGASLRGEWLNQDDSLAVHYVVATEYGGRVTLERSQVAEVIIRSEARSKYDRLAPAVPDTVDDQWKLAKWCEDNDLQEQFEQHLLRVIELDSQHQLARRALGYSEIGGQWVKQDEHLKRQGYVRYQGKWRLPQQVALAKERRAVELAQIEWYLKLSRWRSQLNTEKRHTALQNICLCRDPLAIEALKRLLQVERDGRMRLVYVDVLGQIAGHQASAALVDLALSVRDEEVYYACVDQLAARKTPPIIRQFVLALKSRRNFRVNRAAIALGSLGDQSVIPPLIDALVTQHEMVLPGSSAISTTIARGGTANQSGDTFTTGPSAPTVITQAATNQEVLKTLVKLTGVSFSFDQATWRNWYTLEQRRHRSLSSETRRLD